MPNYSPSVLLAAQAKITESFNKGEMRYTDPVVWKLFNEQSDVMIPNYQALKTADNRAVTMYYKTRAARGSSGNRSHNHTGNKASSVPVTPTWTTVGDVWSLDLKQSANNVFEYQEMFNHELKNAIINVINGLNAGSTAVLFAGRTGVNVANLGVGNEFNLINDVFEIRADNNTDWGVFNNRAGSLTEMVMDINNFGSQYDVVCDSVAYSKFKAQASQGAGNDKNLSFNFGGQRYIHAVGLHALAVALDPTYVHGFWIAVPKGSIASLPWIPIENRQGLDTKVQRYSNIINPIDGQMYAYHEYEERTDGSGRGGQVQDERQQKELTIDASLNIEPLSQANATPLHAVAIVPGS
jgi:hypothetical protein